MLRPIALISLAFILQHTQFILTLFMYSNYQIHQYITYNNMINEKGHNLKLQYAT